VALLFVPRHPLRRGGRSLHAAAAAAAGALVGVAEEERPPAERCSDEAGVEVGDGPREAVAAEATVGEALAEARKAPESVEDKHARPAAAAAVAAKERGLEARVERDNLLVAAPGAAPGHDEGAPLLLEAAEEVVHGLEEELGEWGAVPCPRHTQRGLE